MADDPDLPSWLDLGDDDDDDQQKPDPNFAPGAPAGTPYGENPFVAAVIEESSSRKRWLIGSGAAVAVLAVVIGVLVALTGGSSGTDASTDRSQPAPLPSSSASFSTVSCPTSMQGAVTTGRDAGGTVGGAQVIKAFDYGYYVQRSGTDARSLVAGGAPVGSAEKLQAAIDQLPVGTTHCLQITDRGNGTWGVVLTQQAPGDAQPVVFHQQVQTVDAGGRTWIFSIEEDPQR